MTDGATSRPPQTVPEAQQERWLDQRFGSAPYRDSFQITSELFSEQTPFQHVAIVESVGFGRMLLNDGLVMVSEADEFIYHETMVHVPMCCHPGPRHVLVIGGGDGGIVREVLKHPSVEQCDLVEIDRVVIDACKEFLPSCAASLDDPRVKVHVEDGARFVASTATRYDVVLIDSTDPGGPSESLFEEPFYEAVRSVLAENAIVVAQAGSAYVTRTEHLSMLRLLSKLFPIVEPYEYTNLTYAPGPWAFAFASCGPEPLRDFDPARIARRGLRCRHYNEAIHRAAFARPEWMLAEPTTALPSS